MNLEKLKTIAKEGAVANVFLTGEVNGFIITIATKSGEEETLTTARNPNEPRVFANPVIAFSLLNELGLSNGSFRLNHWNKETQPTRTRLDRKKALKETHQKAEYNRWFENEVKLSLQEADSPKSEWGSNEEVRLQMEQERQKILSRINNP
ncbi:hypothetical protein [Commensalibacter nepenthis]|uniref:Uncharacterized protein n=1 Tax=Commensalibacter nepenthis TaxID=3043872 RepID=A0ABT6Q659_9PROT|nr:hypothetical protein [Commensalibacter sp. TBRC 10068]MDI2111723.1 hypothetical protein [Commensalibacter sp. TBRC 10068]